MTSPDRTAVGRNAARETRLLRRGATARTLRASTLAEERCYSGHSLGRGFLLARRACRSRRAERRTAVSSDIGLEIAMPRLVGLSHPRPRPSVFGARSPSSLGAHRARA